MTTHTKTVYAYDPHSRAFTRALTLDETDLSPADLEHGNLVWLIPGNCLETVPPTAPKGKYVAEENGGWVLKAIPAPVEPAAPAPAPAPDPTELTLAQRVAALRTVVEQSLDIQARAYGYDNINTAVSYAEEKSVPKFWAEGRMFRKLRSLTYAKCYAILAEFDAGKLEEPTRESLLAMLPIPDTIGCARDQETLEAEQAAEAEAAAAAAAADAPQAPAVED